MRILRFVFTGLYANIDQVNVPLYVKSVAWKRLGRLFVPHTQETAAKGFGKKPDILEHFVRERNFKGAISIMYQRMLSPLSYWRCNKV